MTKIADLSLSVQRWATRRSNWLRQYTTRLTVKHLNPFLYYTQAQNKFQLSLYWLLEVSKDVSLEARKVSIKGFWLLIVSLLIQYQAVQSDLSYDMAFITNLCYHR